MSLREHLRVRTPLVWVVSDEPHRVTEYVIDTTAGERNPRKIFRLDPLRGLLEWRRGEDTWIRVLIDYGTDEHGNPKLAPTGDLGDAIMEVYNNHGVMIVENAHRSTENLVGFYSCVAADFLDAVRKDDADRLPAQFVMISCKEEIPPEIARECFKVQFSLPTVDDLNEIFEQFNHGEHHLDDETSTRVVRAGQGLSEHEFVSACLRSVAEQRRYDPELINHLKIQTIEAGGLLEVRAAAATMDTVGGLDHAKEILARTVWIWNHPEEAEKLRIDPLRKILTVGVPGTGKSLLCEAAAHMLGLDLARTGVSQQMSKWVGESEANMRRTFEQIRAMAPICLWIDELGRDLSGSGQQNDSGTTDRVHGTFLTGLQELPTNVFLMCAANRIDGLPPEMTRAERFDKILFVGFPTREERVEIFRIHLGEDHGEYDLELLAEHTELFTGAEIRALVRETRFHIGAVEQRAVKTSELIDQVPKMKGRVAVSHQDQVKVMYERALNEWSFASTKQETEAELVLNMDITRTLSRQTQPRSRGL